MFLHIKHWFTVTNLSVNYGKTNETSTEEPFRYNIHVLFIFFSCFSHRYQFIHGMNSLVEQELLTLPEHLSSTPVLNGVRVTRSSVLCVCFVDRCLSLCTFSFVCVVCSSSIYGFWVPPNSSYILVTWMFSFLFYGLHTRM